MEERFVYVVWTNTDLTEGRGQEYALAYCELMATARRLAKGKYVQGTNCRITQATMFYHAGEWYAPGPRVELGTREDIAEEQRMALEQDKANRKTAALMRARELGMTDSEIEALQLDVAVGMAKAIKS